MLLLSNHIKISRIFTGLQGGTYTFYVRDQYGCVVHKTEVLQGQGVDAKRLGFGRIIEADMIDDMLFWIDEDRKFMLQKNWKRPVTDSSFFLHEKLEWMDEHQIDHAVVLNLSQLYGNGLRVETMKQVLRWQNDFNAKVQADHPNRFTCGFVIHAAIEVLHRVSQLSA